MTSDQSSESSTRQLSGDGRLDGRTALITGGARGQGAAEARRFIEHGATVVITDILDVEGEVTARELGPMCTYLRHDVTDQAAWQHVVDEIVSAHGSIDILVNNAGVFLAGSVLEHSLEVWNRVIAINQTGVFLGMQTVGREMVKKRAGSIVNISSIAGLQGSPGFHAYCASKWAVRGMTKAAAKELAPHGVRVNSVHPGIIDTKMLETFDNVNPGLRDAIRPRIPMGHFATADDVADVVLFLASDASRYCTGSEFVVDGGMTA